MFKVNVDGSARESKLNFERFGLNMESPVTVSCVESHGPEDIQQCLIPSSLLLYIKGSVGSYINIKLTKDSSLVCRAVPLLNSYSNMGFQVIASNCVRRGCKNNLSPVADSFTITVSDIKTLKAIELHSVKITVILKSVEDVLQYRKHKECSYKIVCRLLRFYCIASHSDLKCSGPLAELIGISRILVEKCELSDDDVGIISSKTQVVISTVESEDKIRLSAQSTVRLGGLDDVLSYLLLLVTEPWLKQKEFGESGVLYPSGVLLVGPPGCGKTSLVRQLCAETGASLIGTSGADLTSPYEGETEENLIKLAERAKKLSEEGPCIFFVDEIDSLCPARTEESSLFSLKMAAQVLLTIDKCRSCKNLILMAATNRPYDLDPALRRSGRFEVEILLNVPSTPERERILATHCHSILLNYHSGLAVIADATPGYVGADLKALCDKTEIEIAERYKDESLVKAEKIVELMLACAKSIIPSIHKNLEFITTKPPVSSLGGLSEVKLILEEMFVLHTDFADGYDKLKLRRPKGVLLYGPRGCGKTRLVASLASKRGCSFFAANASHLLSPYVGDSEKRVAALFHAAHLAQPSIVFIDEIDGIFRSRDGKKSGVHISLLNELLQALDGANVRATTVQGVSYLSSNLVSNQDRVLVCAATNHPDLLDPALLRPGRFDNLVYVPPPDFEARLDILKLKTSQMCLPSSTILQTIAHQTSGFTGAELEHMVMKAAVSSIKEKIARKDNAPVCLEERHLLDALEQSSPAVTEKEILRFKEFSMRLSAD